MPNFDGSGPMGYGAMTGRGMGCCGARSGRFRGWGLGLGRFRSAKNNLLALEEEEALLKEELAVIEEEKKALRSQK